MRQGSYFERQLWPRLAAAVVAAGTLFLTIQCCDLWALSSFADMTPPARMNSTVAPVAYVPVASAQAGLAADWSDDLVATAEVSDGGELGRLVREMLRQYHPLIIAEERGGVVYVPLAPLAALAGGELRWQDGMPQGALVMPDSLVTFNVSSRRAYRDYEVVMLEAPPLVRHGRIEVPLKAVAGLTGMNVSSPQGAESGHYELQGPSSTMQVVVRQRMFRLEASRSGRWLQVYLLGQPAKRYPLCTGKGENTPVGEFHIVNKAVWPPWNAYWGEYMPGGSSRNPLGARWLGTSAHGRETGRVIGIHGTNEPSSIGKRISGGCMRTFNHYAIELYNNIPVGTPLSIHE